MLNRNHHLITSHILKVNDKEFHMIENTNGLKRLIFYDQPEIESECWLKLNSPASLELNRCQRSRFTEPVLGSWGKIKAK